LLGGKLYQRDVSTSANIIKKKKLRSSFNEIDKSDK